MFERITLWNKWRKRNYNSTLYKLLVLLNLRKSPTFECVLSGKDASEYVYICEVFKDDN